MQVEAWGLLWGEGVRTFLDVIYISRVILFFSALFIVPMLCGFFILVPVSGHRRLRTTGRVLARCCLPLALALLGKCLATLGSQLLQRN